jgi:hypothetical protein
MLDNLRALVAQESQEHLLGDVVQVGYPRSPTADQEFAQRRAPAPEPLGQGILGTSRRHVCKTGSGEKITPLQREII